MGNVTVEATPAHSPAAPAMSDSFDPYYKWLGIKPKDQPPNHYRLLGVEMFESDEDVIENAADQRMRHMRSLQSGANAEASQHILNEVAAARVCLTDPVKRSEYDEKLKNSRPVAHAALPPQAPPPAPPVGTAVAPPVAAVPRSQGSNGRSAPAAVSFAAAAPTARPRTSARRKNAFPTVLVTSGAGVLVLLILAMVLMGVLKSGPETAIRPGPIPVETKQAAPVKFTTTTGASSPARPVPPPENKTPPQRPKPTGELHLLEIPTMTLGQGQSLRVQATVRDPDRWKAQVRFAPGLGVPAGTEVNAESGWIEWSPPKEARGMYLFNIEARAGADEATTSFQVNLPWARGDLLFSDPGEHHAYPGEPLIVHLSARDDIGPVEGAQFELLSGPAGAVVERGTNQFRWQATEGQLDTKQRVTLRVTDSRGVMATASFTIQVERKPIAAPGDSNGERSRPELKEHSRRRNDLRFNGNGYVATSWRYDGSTPLTLEVMAMPLEVRRCAALGCMHLSGIAIAMTEDGRSAFVVQDKDGSRQIASDEPAKPHEQDHVAGVFANGKMSLFVDGKLQRETAQVAQFVPSRHSLLIGADTNGEGHPEALFRGMMRSVRASNTARYRESFQRVYRLEPEPGTTLLLDFSEGSGDEVKDRSGQTPPAKIHGAVWTTR